MLLSIVYCVFYCVYSTVSYCCFGVISDNKILPDRRMDGRADRGDNRYTLTLGHITQLTLCSPERTEYATEIACRLVRCVKKDSGRRVAFSANVRSDAADSQASAVQWRAGCRPNFTAALREP